MKYKSDLEKKRTLLRTLGFEFEDCHWWVQEIKTGWAVLGCLGKHSCLCPWPEAKALVLSWAEARHSKCIWGLWLLVWFLLMCPLLHSCLEAVLDDVTILFGEQLWNLISGFSETAYIHYNIRSDTINLGTLLTTVLMLSPLVYSQSAASLLYLYGSLWFHFESLTANKSRDPKPFYVPVSVHLLSYFRASTF